MSLLTHFRSSTPDPTATGQATVDAVAPSRKRRWFGQAVTVLAGVILFLDLAGPDRHPQLTPAIFLRIPVEGLVFIGLMLVLPRRARRVVAAVLGAVLGVLTVGKLLDLGFYSTLVRPFDPVLDWALFDDAYGFLVGSVGRAGAIAAAVAVVLLAVGLLGASALSAVRVAGLVSRHGRRSRRVLLVLGALWAVCSLLGMQLVPGVPVASHSTTVVVQERVDQVLGGLRDKAAFAKEAKVDAFSRTPGSQLLGGLRGKDVLFTFVESYGRSALQDPTILHELDPALADGDRRLKAAGYSARSGFLTSPTSGGGSWLAHGTLMSGLWINNQERYRSLVHSDRLTLAGAFKRADWRTVGVEPGTTSAWPDGKFYGYDKIYAAKNLDYKGPHFTLSTMPDQYTLSAFERFEHGKKGHAPLMAEIPLVSSHSPWAPVPRSLDWNDVGNGSVYNPMVSQVDSASTVWGGGALSVRKAYGHSVAYSIDTLVSYLEKYGDDNLVLVFLGDHQPAPIVTGASPNRDVPITIVARDKRVLDRVSGWGWQDGLKPNADAPVWRMNEFRDRFLTTFAK